MLGRDPENDAGRPLKDFVHEDDREAVAQMLARIITQPVSETLTVRALCGDGTYRWVEAAGRAVRDPRTGAVLEVRTAARDISARKQAEDALLESESRFRLLAENATDVIVRESLRHGILYVSPSARPVFGYDPQGVLGRPAMEFIHPDDREAVSQAAALARARPGVQTVTYRILRPDATCVWVEAAFRIVRDQTGEEIELQSSLRDISARKQAEDALRRSEERYRRIVETALEAIYQIDAAGRIVFANQRSAELTGYTLDELAGKPADDLVGPAERLAARARGAARRAGELDRLQHEQQWQCKDGTTRWMQVCAVPIADEQGRYSGLFCMATDIHERKLAEQALQEHARERLERLRVAEALAEASDLLAGSLAFETIPASILEVMARVVPCTTTHVFVYRDGQVEVAGSYGEPKVPLGTVVGRLDAGKGIFPRTVGEADVLGETRSAPGWRSLSPWVGEHEVRSAILLPWPCPVRSTGVWL